MVISKKYRKLMLAVAAIVSLYIVRATGLDQGLIDDVLNSAVEVITETPEELPAQ